MILKADSILVGDDFDELAPGLVRVEDDKIVELGADVSTTGDEVIDFTKKHNLREVGCTCKNIANLLKDTEYVEKYVS